MALTKVLITVKTYPTLSAKYDELVCTAGFKENGTWIACRSQEQRTVHFFGRF